MIKTVRPKEAADTINEHRLVAILFYSIERTLEEQETIEAVSEANAAVVEFSYVLVPLGPSDAEEVEVARVPQLRIYRDGSEIKAMTGAVSAEKLIPILRDARDP